MFNIDFTFLWVLVNLAIIYFVLNKFLFKRLGGFMDKRSADIAANIEKGEAMAREAEEMRRRQEEALSEAYGERKKILDEAVSDASKEYDKIIVEAKTAASDIMTEAREENEREREKMYGELRNEIAGLAIQAASKVIEANMDSDKNRELVNEFLSNEGVA